MLDRMGYNFSLKIAGKHITLQKYNQVHSFNFTDKPKTAVLKIVKGSSTRQKDNFIKSITRARKRLFDLIACNVNQVPDYYGIIQRPKFWTLTFAENITDLQEANSEFTKFNKRLSYYLYGESRNVLKYVCVPEFQKRGAVHFHVLYFNLPYIKQDEFQEIWGNGFTFVESVSEKDEIEDFAKYISKYINKENSKGEDNFSLYLDKDLLNQKRYFSSRGLIKPSVYKLNIDKQVYQEIIAQMSEFHTNNYEVENEFVGKIEINNYEVQDKEILNKLQEFVLVTYKNMKGFYDKKVIINPIKKKKTYYDFESLNKADRLRNKALAVHYGYPNGFVMSDAIKQVQALGLA